MEDEKRGTPEQGPKGPAFRSRSDPGANSSSRHRQQLGSIAGLEAFLPYSAFILPPSSFILSLPPNARLE
jgi:hypothetical protein